MRNDQQLKEIAKKMVSKGKGILAADESTPTCKKRFDSISIESTFENRNKYRNMLFTSDRIESTDLSIKREHSISLLFFCL